MMVISEADEGMRLDRWFGAYFPQFTHGQVQKCLRKGQIRIDGARVKANARLTAGQSVRVPPDPVAAAEDGRERRKPFVRALSKKDRDYIRKLVIYQDDDFIAINKPSGLPVQGGSGQERHIDGLLDGLRFDADERPKLVHRLDKDTSGVLLLARSRRAAADMGKQLKRHQLSKLYWALVIGVPKPHMGTIDAPLAKVRVNDREQMQVSDERDRGERAKDARRGGRSRRGGGKGEAGKEEVLVEGQKAVSRYAVISSAGQRLSFAALTPVTGRTHQLRIHMSLIGHPIVGDGKYGGREAHPGGEISSKLHLHARSLRFKHPKTGRQVSIIAPLPEHMAYSWALFGFDAEARNNPFEDDDCAGACRV